MNSLWISLSLFFHLSLKKFCKQCQDLPKRSQQYRGKKRVNYKSRCWFSACFTSSLTQQETLQALMYLYSSVGGGNGNPLQYSCLENPMDQGAWWATIHGVAKSQTRLSGFCVCVCVCVCVSVLKYQQRFQLEINKWKIKNKYFCIRIVWIKHIYMSLLYLKI